MTSRVVVYGAGEMGKATIDWLNNANIFPEVVLDRNEDLLGEKINDLDIIIPELYSNYKDAIVLVAMSARPFFEIKKYLMKLGATCVYIAGDYISRFFGDYEFANVWKCKENEWKEWPLTIDSISTTNLTMAKGWFIHRNENAYFEGDLYIDREKYFPEFIKRYIKKNDYYVDSSFLSGEFWNKFKTFNQNSKCGLCFNATDEECELYANVQKIELGDKEYSNNVYSFGLMKPYTSTKLWPRIVKPLDSFENIKMNYFRVYSMQRILPILEGARKSIKKNRPIISMNIGHFQSDFFDVPAWLNDNLIDYHYEFRMHSFQGNDCILYAIPFERKLVM